MTTYNKLAMFFTGKLSYFNFVFKLDINFNFRLFRINLVSKEQDDVHVFLYKTFNPYLAQTDFD